MQDFQSAKILFCPTVRWQSSDADSGIGSDSEQHWIFFSCRFSVAATRRLSRFEFENLALFFALVCFVRYEFKTKTTTEGHTHFELFLKEEAADSALFFSVSPCRNRNKTQQQPKTDFVSAINQTAAV